ncbi:MAG: bifunctional folylpolyglutamate synthase/dihydrofolate synthase [Pseudobdellovibrio sp.]
MYSSYREVVQFLESLQIMPKTMPGLQKIEKALTQTDWFSRIDPNKVIVVAGTNGKGTTCAALEALLIEAGQKTAFYSSPHLVSTTERMRVNSENISEENFVKLFNECESLIKSCELSHFEALTLMAGHYFFSSSWNLNLDFVIFEVGLGGVFDATNAFPHKYSVITKLGLDHVQILGNRLADIAQNKFGIVTKKGIVVHQPLAAELYSLKDEFQRKTNSNWVEVDAPAIEVKLYKNTPQYFLKILDLKFPINILGRRAAENIMTAITTFHVMGFVINGHEQALNRINWQGRMQKLNWPGLKAPLYLSGDHNLQGIESLEEILKDFSWRHLHLVVGIGVDKDADAMFAKLSALPNVKLYLTETPFKGRKLEDYPEKIKAFAVSQNTDPLKLIEQIKAEAVEEDLCLVTGSLYLVGDILKAISI